MAEILSLEYPVLRPNTACIRGRVPGTIPKLGYQGIPGTGHGSEIWVPEGTGYRARFRNLGTRGYRLPGAVPKLGYQGVPGTGHGSEIWVPEGTGYGARLRNLGTRGYRVPGTIPKLGY